MNPREKKLLDELGIYIDPYLTNKYKKQMKVPDEWTRFYYYRKKKKIIVPQSQVSHDHEVTSTATLHRGTFYKMSHLSNADLFYDYFYKLKHTVGTCVIKKCKNQNTPQTPVVEKAPVVREVDETGKFVIRWD
jgi:hypothetical protein